MRDHFTVYIALITLALALLGFVLAAPHWLIDERYDRVRLYVGLPLVAVALFLGVLALGR